MSHIKLRILAPLSYSDKVSTGITVTDNNAPTLIVTFQDSEFRDNRQRFFSHNGDRLLTWAHRALRLFERVTRAGNIAFGGSGIRMSMNSVPTYGPSAPFS